jgi:predicted glutamine amidotransferase
MGFCFAFVSNDANLSGCALTAFSDPLMIPGGAPHGWGLGYYQAGQPLLRKQPKPLEEPLDFATRAGQLRTSLVLGHVRDATVGGQRTENTHPFRYRNWIFCHTGTVDRFDGIKDDLLRAIPDFIRRNIRGGTDSEHLFHLFLSFLNDTGRMDDLRVRPEVVAQALASTYAYVDRLVSDRGGTPSTGCCLLSNGNIVVGTRRGQDLKLIRNQSFQCKGPDGKPINANHLKAVVMMGGTTPNLPGWETIAERAIVTVDSRLNIEYSTPL